MGEVSAGLDCDWKNLIQQIKFFEGISTSFELSEAQRQLYTMQQNYLQSMASVIATKAALDNALNTPINN